MVFKRVERFYYRGCLQALRSVALVVVATLMGTWRHHTHLSAASRCIGNVTPGAVEIAAVIDGIRLAVLGGFVDRPEAERLTGKPTRDHQRYILKRGQREDNDPFLAA